MRFEKRRVCLIFFVFVTSFVSNLDHGILGNNISSPSSNGYNTSRYKKYIKNDIARHKGMMQRDKWRSAKLKSSKTSKRLTEEDDDVPIGEREGPKKSMVEGSVKIPMYPAAEYHMGQYMVEIEIGTPPRKLHMVADTGSDLTWIKCKNLDRTRLKDKHVFDADASSTFLGFSCDDPRCYEDFKLLSSLDICPNPQSPCLYNYSYADEGLSTFGQFGREKITLHTTKGKTIALENMLLGCSDSYTGTTNIDAADGILGLAVHPFSFALQAASKFGGVFSYCLVDHLKPHNVTNYLFFGDQREKCPTKDFMRYTALHVTEESPYYWLYIKGVSVGSNMIDVGPSIWDEAKNGGTILDLGSTITYWVEPAYYAIMDSLIKTLEKDFPKLPDWKGDGLTDFEYCFNANSKNFDKSKMPWLEIHFNDGGRFRPHVQSYIIDDSPGVKCIGFLQASGGVNIIGNILQQNYLWEFDIHHESVGFVASTCE